MPKLDKLDEVGSIEDVGKGIRILNVGNPPQTPVFIYPPTIYQMHTTGWIANYWVARLAGVIEYHYNTRKHPSA